MSAIAQPKVGEPSQAEFQLTSDESIPGLEGLQVVKVPALLGGHYLQVIGEPDTDPECDNLDTPLDGESVDSLFTVNVQELNPKTGRMKGRVVKASKEDETGFEPGNVKSELWHIENILKIGKQYSMVGLALAKAIWDALDDGVDGYRIVDAWADKGYKKSTVRNRVTEWKHENGVEVEKRGPQGKKDSKAGGSENAPDVDKVINFVEELAQEDVNYGLTITDALKKWTAVLRAAANKTKNLDLTPKAE